MADEVEIVAPDPSWPAKFEREAARIRAALPAGLIRRIDHIGSTAVSGLAAKPIIDIMLELTDFARAGETIPVLKALGYVFWPDNPDPHHRFFVRGMPPYGTGRTHHVHIYELAAKRERQLRFRDLLRADSQALAAYAALKHRLAAAHRSDREAYTQAKAAFIDDLLARGA
jgi:GrpB-like predicted nucleotidyltransferase (UPF0157 family)